jgi:uncharacterized protein
MVAWKIFRRKPRILEKVTLGRFEIERDGEIAYLEYSMAGNILTLIHTEVPAKLRGLGLASSLAETGFRWARENKFKVDVVCPLATEYLAKHPEYADLILR